MTDRRTTVLDAAVELVGTHGMRGLTHRAVDQAAGLPSGSTSNLFRTREALVAGIVERYVERERLMASGPQGEVDASPDGVAKAFAGFVSQALGTGRAVTQARYAILVEKAQTPALREITAFGAARVNAWVLPLLQEAGSPDPERDLDVLSNYITGLVLHELSSPSPDLDAEARIRSLIATLGWSAR